MKRRIQQFCTQNQLNCELKQQIIIYTTLNIFDHKDDLVTVSLLLIQEKTILKLGLVSIYYIESNKCLIFLIMTKSTGVVKLECFVEYSGIRVVGIKKTF